MLRFRSQHDNLSSRHDAQCFPACVRGCLHSLSVGTHPVEYASTPRPGTNCWLIGEAHEVGALCTQSLTVVPVVEGGKVLVAVGSPLALGHIGCGGQTPVRVRCVSHRAKPARTRSDGVPLKGPVRRCS
eukprot:scaffold7236_cov377-Prasinococcus_capsulatus_cf.AAC.2